MTEPVHFESLYPADSRHTEIQKLLACVKSGNACQITGLPGVGRSNVLQLLSYNKQVRTAHLGDNQKWFHFVLLNCAEIKDRPLPDTLKFIFLSLADSLRDRGLQAEHDKLHDIFSQHASFADDIVLFQGLKEAMDFLTLEKQLTIVFSFDRFEEYIPSLTPQFFSNLRILRDRAKYRFSAIFSTPRPLEELVEASVLSDFHEFLSGSIVYLSLFDKPSLDFRIAYLEKSHSAGSGQAKKMDKNTVESIYGLTGGHGKLTRIAIEELLSQSVTEKTLLESKSIQRALFEIWNFLTPAEQSSIHVILNSIQDLPKEIPGQARNDTLVFLEHSGLIQNNHISIPLFAHFIKTRGLIVETQKETIEFNPTNNTIVKGHVVLSENLTSAEFKLLKYLIANSEKIIEREEIITSVWQDAKSTAGVTDQALDQLMFRLRKKIEDDPNNPTHLVTIKGRGFKFSP